MHPRFDSGTWRSSQRLLFSVMAAKECQVAWASQVLSLLALFNYTVASRQFNKRIEIFPPHSGHRNNALNLILLVTCYGLTDKATTEPSRSYGSKLTATLGANEHWRVLSLQGSIISINPLRTPHVENGRGGEWDGCQLRSRCANPVEAK
ncbi:hypothetical protein F5Y17DRAFT_189953 [Xylariaceae sp. FL0594]|nr:hypothetical protein F5Y17DRAFT_189953 [Xylariaceae sp. FL0594]